MAGKGRDRLPPYEVMGRVGGGGEPGSGPESGAEGAPPVFGAPFGGSGPIVLRIPRGYGVLAMLIAIGGLVLAYWVGYHQGMEAIRKEQRAQRQADLEVGHRAQSLTQLLTRNESPNPTSSGSAPANPPRTPTPRPTPIPPLSEGDPRQPGLNYFVLVHYPPEEARLLVQFLRERGVEAGAISVDNKRFKVVALQGFTSDQLQGPQRRSYEQKLRQLGRLWQSERRGAGDLSDMYPELHRAP